MNRSRMPAEMQVAWDRRSVERERATFVTAHLLICVLVPLWSLLDVVVVPRLAPRFILMRVPDVAVTLALWRLVARSSSLRGNRLAMVASLLAVGLLVIAMLVQVGPTLYGLYTFGFSLVFWGAGLLLIWPVAYCAATFAALLLAHGLAFAMTRDVSAANFVGSLFYLGSAALISCAQIAVRRRLERQAFDASYALGARNAELACTVAALDATQARLRASGAGLAESLDLATTADRVVAMAVPTFASWATLTVAGPEAAPVYTAAHVDPDRGVLLRRALAAQPALQVGPGREVERIAEAKREDVARAVGPQVSEFVTARSIVVAPLVARGRRIGTLVLGRTDRGYDAAETAFVEEITLRASLALDNARLYAVQQSARDLADAANRAKDDFLASVSHELRTPLSAILGWAKMLSLPLLEARKHARAVETIERNAVAMSQLIEDLLDVSRIVSGKFRLDASSVNVAGVVEAAIESVRPAADAKSIRIVQDLAGDVGVLHGDSGRLQQVVWNLVSNAVKFTPANGQVNVELRKRETNAEIVVRDTGRGIEPRFLPHVFEPFRQADGGITRPTSGLGLGLAIVKHIVELHGGVAEAFSEGPGKGATFTVRLPLPAQPSVARPAAPQGRRPFRSPPQLDGLRVLVVEDEADMRQLVREVLTSCGSRVTTASSVAEAMGHLESGEIPDVLISDIGMEGESGYDLIRRVRARPASLGGRMPAAALTAYARAEDRRKVLRAGFELHVPKPVEPEELVSAVATLAKFADER